MSKLSLEKQIYRHATDLSHACFRLLVIVMTYTDERGCNAHPSNARLAEEAGMDVANVRKNMKRLQELGYVVKTEDGGNKHGHGKANVYRVQVPAQLEAREVELRRVRTKSGEPNANGLEGGNGYPPRGASVPAKGGSENPPSDQLPDPSSDPKFHGQNSVLTPREVIGEQHWKNLLDHVQAVAANQRDYELADDLDAAMREATHEEIADWHANYFHTPPRTAVDRKLAGKWLNTLFNTARAEGFDYAPVNAALTA